MFGRQNMKLAPRPPRLIVACCVRLLEPAPSPPLRRVILPPRAIFRPRHPCRRSWWHVGASAELRFGAEEEVRRLCRPPALPGADTRRRGGNDGATAVLRRVLGSFRGLVELNRNSGSSQGAAAVPEKLKGSSRGLVESGSKSSCVVTRVANNQQPTTNNQHQTTSGGRPTPQVY